MKFLVDQNQSPLVAELLTEAGHDAVHTRGIGMETASDPEVLARAVADGRVLISADTDFGTLLAQSGDQAPSVILLRRSQDRRAMDVAALVLANLEVAGDALEAGAVVVLEEERMRIRRLPVR